MVVTNNLFVNVGMVPDYPGFYPLFDDDDMLAKGIINTDTIDDVWISNWWLDADGNSFYPVVENERKVLFDNNSAWWDPRLDDMVKNKMQPIPADIGNFSWMSQMILYNDRTKAMFDDDAAYPYFNLGENLNIQPDFAKNEDLVDQWVDYVITNCTPGAPNGGNQMPKWRTNLTTEVFIPDWPMLADLSYTEATLKGAGLNGYPLGDLNWFKDLKSQWETTGEPAKLIEALKTKNSLPVDWAPLGGNGGNGIPSVKSNLGINAYPNPFKESINLTIDLATANNILFTVFDINGKLLKSIDYKNMPAGRQVLNMNTSDIKAGMYLYKIQLGNAYQCGRLVKY
jgi:hypothetical protein